ncbi:hypothetical protein E1287_41160 [Actinomadura sp. KC06]|uniref:hypothetical protein n=1 Tax=Actinomadura sp. KC06 TaxID=2530369 RepID=UPI0010440029|nr:hypothetical protein [Actinomadura sp. KC06]TDD20693.1 hypothetical protein E1287_41160 [Actinomadura sp. KC06]
MGDIAARVTNMAKLSTSRLELADEIVVMTAFTSAAAASRRALFTTFTASLISGRERFGLIRQGMARRVG